MKVFKLEDEDALALYNFLGEVLYEGTQAEATLESLGRVQAALQPRVAPRG